MGTPVDTILSVAKKNCLAGMGLIYSFCLLGAVGFRHFCHRGFGFPKPRAPCSLGLKRIARRFSGLTLGLMAGSAGA